MLRPYVGAQSDAHLEGIARLDLAGLHADVLDPCGPAFRGEAHAQAHRLDRHAAKLVLHQHAHGSGDPGRDGGGHVRGAEGDVAAADDAPFAFDLDADLGGALADALPRAINRAQGDGRRQPRGEQAVGRDLRVEGLARAADFCVAHRHRHRDGLGLLAGDAGDRPQAVLRDTPHGPPGEPQLHARRVAGHDGIDVGGGEREVNIAHGHHGMAERQHLVALDIGHGADGGDIEIAAHELNAQRRSGL